MQKKIIILMQSLVCFSSAIYSMDDQTVGSAKRTNSLSRRNSKETLDATGDVRISVASNNIPAAVPPLYLDPALTQDPKHFADPSSQSLKTPIRTVAVLRQELQRAKSTGRSSRSPHVVRRNVVAQGAADIAEKSTDVDADITIKPTLSLLPHVLIQKNLGIKLQNNKSYTEDEVWDLLQHVNPILYKFGQQHALKLDDIIEYAALLEQLDVKPQALLEFVEAHINLDGKDSGYLKSFFDTIGINSTDNKQTLQAYKDIKKKNPEKYGELILELIKKLSDQEEGQQKPSVIADTHIGVQNDQINDQASTIRQQWVAIALQFITTIGAAAWGAYGQATKTASGTNCTGS